MSGSDATQVTARPDLAIVAEDIAGLMGRLGDSPAALAGSSILITGAGGMIGGYLADIAAAISSSSPRSRSTQIFLATRTMPSAHDRLGHLVGRPDVTFLVPEEGSVPALPTTVDFVIHAASPASPTTFLTDPVGALHSNSTYLGALLDLAVRSGSQGFVYVSSSEVYGDPGPADIPTPETYVGSIDPLSPRASYAEGKRFGESLCMAYHRQHDLPVAIVRPFHIHGPGLRLDDGRIVADLIRVGLQGRPFQLESDGSATRCYGYVADAAVGIYRAMWYGNGEAFNIGADAPETSMLDLATTVAKLMGTPPPRINAAAGPVHLPGAPRRSRPDLGKAREKLAYRPVVPLEAGLMRTIQWHVARERVHA
jgi:nucleoside-diphosphate-sugar epimerase